MSVPDTCVIIPAAGWGERIGGETPKQYITVCHKPLIYYTLQAFVGMDFVKRIVVVAAPSYVSMMREIVTLLPAKDREKVEITCGGSSRHESISMGIQSLSKSGGEICDVITIHDGVRPFIDEDILKDVLRAAEKFGAAGVMCPLVSTVIAVDEGGFLDHALDRSKFRASEMPQAFSYHILKDAYEKCSPDDMKYGTECLHLVQKYGEVKAKMVPGNSLCWKVTVKRDLHTARALVKEMESVDIVGDHENLDFHNALRTSILSRFKKVVDGACKVPGQSVPNHVVLHPNGTTADVIEQEELQETFSFTCDPVTLVHVTFDGDMDLDIQSLQRRARSISKQNKNKKIISYYVVTRLIMSPELQRETAETVASLLFQSNEKLNGFIFLMV